MNAPDLFATMHAVSMLVVDQITLSQQLIMQYKLLVLLVLWTVVDSTSGTAAALTSAVFFGGRCDPHHKLLCDAICHCVLVHLEQTYRRNT